MYIYIYITRVFRGRPPICLPRPVIARLQYHTTRVGGRLDLVETYRCYD